MGPPKKRPPKPNFADIRRKWNIFEYRWSDETDSYYMFNPWTGETIFDTNLELLDRTKSMWAPPEKYPSENAVTVSIYPEFYASRRWGRRRFTGWESEYAAATMIAALVRGYLARLLLRRIFKERFILEFDANSGYYYFIDTENRHLDTSWYKPLLAFPNDIELIPVEDPEDYMRGNKFSKQDTTVGPFLKIAGPNKHMTTRAEQSAFLVRNEWRDTALSSYEEIDVDKVPIGSVIPWMLGMKCGSLLVTEFHAVRAAITNGNWSRTLQFMKSNSDNILIQIYGFHSFSKTEVPLDDSGLLNFVSLLLRGSLFIIILSCTSNNLMIDCRRSNAAVHGYRNR